MLTFGSISADELIVPDGTIGSVDRLTLLMLYEIAAAVESADVVGAMRLDTTVEANVHLDTTMQGEQRVETRVGGVFHSNDDA